MIAKIPKPGRSFGGVVEYNVLRKDAELLFADGIRTDHVKHMIADFNMQRKLNPGLGQAVGHIALGFSANDKGRLTNDLMTAIAKDYLQRMKIENTQVLIVRHQDKAHPHLHIVYNRVNNDGKTIADNFQQYKSIKITKALTLQHGLYIALDKKQVKREQLKGADKVKYELYDKIKAASKQVNTIGELKQILAKQGITTQYKLKSGSLEIQGVSFSKGKYTFKGSEIDRSLSYGNLAKQLQEQAKEKQIVVQQPSLAQQLREVLNSERGKEQGSDRQALSAALDLFGHMPVISTDPEPPRKRRKKGQGEDEEQSRGMKI
ncbi:mobilization protein [Mucilaginibacter sp. MD40]|uniref:relaxase/mobilization nuclease domain-containing protein n=1 Tax=Mucilaginibacter sp. MD40 TaxID=2029590 RepID=UPI000BACB51E|nr:relaxase/mobilization nuclease domain-containing protein [Mucilaginibacter sp. MD40]PAW93914.1 mobilization protein [Mucilaginibacter sp. MD40]